MILTKNHFFTFSEGKWSEDDYVAFSPDSRYLLSVARSSRELILIWNLNTGKLLQTLTGHKGSVEHAAFLPSGTQVISLSADGELLIWNLSDGTYNLIELIKEKIIKISLSSEGSSLYLFDNLYSFQIINLREKKMVKYYWITPISLIEEVFPLDDTLFLCVKDNQGKFELFEKMLDNKFEKSSQQNIKVWARQLVGGFYPSISVSKYGNYVVETICTDIGQEGEYEHGEANIWDLNSNTLVRSLPLDLPWGGFTLSSNGRYFSDGESVWKTHSGECVFSGNFGVCRGFSPDERHAFILPENGQAHAYKVNLEGSRKSVEVFGGHGTTWGVKSYLASDCCLTTDGLSEFILVWTLDSGSVRHCLGLRSFNLGIDVVFLSHNGKFVITRGRSMSERSIIGLWSLLSGDLVFESSEFQNDDVVITPDQNFILSKSLLVDINKNKVIRKFENHEEYCNPISLSNNGYLVISGSNDGSIVLWSLLTGDELGRLRDQDKSSFRYLEISQNNKYCLSLGSAKGIQVWSLEDKALHKALGMDKKVFCASFMLGEKYIISSSEDKRVRIWFVESGQIIYELEQSEEITSLYVSPNNTLIYLGSESGVSTWDLKME